MKTPFLVLCAAILCLGCSDNKPAEKTVVGLFTPYQYFPESVNGRVKEIKETNYFPVEKEGKIVAGVRLTRADLDSLNFTPDFIVRFNEFGLAESVDHLDENDDVFEYWKITNDSVYPVSAEFWIKDSIVNLSKITKIDENSYQWDIINPKTDTLRNRAILMYADKSLKNLNWFSSSGKPLSSFEWTYDPSKHLTGYTYSSNDTVRGGMNFTFNERGLFEIQEIFNKITGKSDKIRYEYEYDNAGNWIKIVAFRDENPLIVGVREYKYY